MKKLIFGIIAITFAAISFSSCEKTEEGNGEGKITSFSLTGITNAPVIINNETLEVTVIVPTGTNLTSLTPSIGISAGASISPNTGVATDFSNPITYTVTASDNQTYTWKVYVFAGGGGELVLVNSNITTATTWIATKTYIVDGDIDVNADLVIQPGTWVRFKSGASLSIGYYEAASITANGTVNNQIFFTSTSANPAAGAWDGIYLYSNNSSNSSIKFCNINFAGTTDKGALNIDGTSCTFSNNNIQYAKSVGILNNNTESYLTDMNNNTISNCGGHALKISATEVHTIGTGNTFTCASNYGINVWGSTISGTVTWKKHTVPYYIEGEVSVDNATLTIEQGSILKFDATGSMGIGYYNTATLIANGIASNNIIFTSSATSPSAGAWNGIYFYSNNQQNSSMTYCEVAYAGKTNHQAISIDATKLTFDHNNVHHSNGLGFDLNTEGGFVVMTNNTISNCASHAISISGKNFHTIGANNVITTLTGFGISLNGGAVETAVTWKKQPVPVYINSEIGIENTLTIEAGSTFKFGANGSIYVGYYNTAQLNAIGTSTNPIVFTASSETPAAGAWSGITFYSNTSSNTTLDYCEILYAGKGTNSDRAAIYLNQANGLTIKNSTLMDSNGWGIYEYVSTLSAGSINNTFTNCNLGQIGSSI